MVKVLGAQRESDGVVVPLIGVQHNAPGGKGPDFDHVHQVGKREGMTGSAWSNFPGKPSLAVADGEPLCSSGVKVRELQRALWAAAKQSEGRRFHALYDRVCRGDVLREAWFRVCKNKGAAGVDRITLAAVEDYGVDRMLRELRRDLRTGRYRPAPARRVEIPKPRGGKRPLGIPTVRDRVAQQAAKPSQTAMARLRTKVRDRSGRNRVGLDIREVIAELNPILRGWGNYFRTGNAAIKFIQIDRYVSWRLKGLLVKKRGRNLRAGQADQWTRAWFEGHGLHRLSGTIRYPRAA